MILTVAFVALLLCAEAQAVKKRPECKDWACFASDKCIEGGQEEDLVSLRPTDKLVDDCSAFLMIKPYSTKKWLIVLESLKDSVNEISVSHEDDAKFKFSCKKDTNGFVSDTALPYREDKGIYWGKLLRCQFLVGNEEKDILITSSKNIIMNSGSSSSNMVVQTFLSGVTGKLMCDLSKIKFENSASPEDAVTEADVQFKNVSCTNSQYSQLQYKPDAKYENVGAITCETDPNDANKFKYKIGGQFKDKDIHARCHAKACSLCTQPTTPAGKTKPVFGEADGCKTLTCPKFFKIGDIITDDKAMCVKTEGNKFVWKIGESSIAENTAVECVEQKQCAAITNTACPEPCTLDSTGMPSCSNGYEISITSKNVKNLTIACDTMTGQLKYTEHGKDAQVLPEGSTFSCTATKQSEEKVATGGNSGVPSPLRTCIAVATVLSLLLVILSVGLWYWRKRKNEAKAVADSKSKPEKENGTKDKGEAKQEE